MRLLRLKMVCDVTGAVLPYNDITESLPTNIDGRHSEPLSVPQTINSTDKSWPTRRLATLPTKSR